MEIQPYNIYHILQVDGVVKLNSAPDLLHTTSGECLRHHSIIYISKYNASFETLHICADDLRIMNENSLCAALTAHCHVI